MLATIPLYDDAPHSALPVATYGLIGACAAVFLWQLGLPPRAADNVAFAYGMVPAVLFGHGHLPPQLHAVPPLATIFTSMFLHGGWAHLLGNMLYLWLFGRGVEWALGPARFLAFYLICGVAAALTQGLVDPESAVPMIGASGAIAGVLGAYLVLFPRGQVAVFIWIIIFFRIVSVPAVILLGLWFLLQLMGAVSTAGEPGVAVWAHVGGFLTGMALIVPFRRRGVGLFGAARSASFTLAPPRRQRGPWG